MGRTECHPPMEKAVLGSQKQQVSTSVIVITPEFRFWRDHRNHSSAILILKIGNQTHRIEETLCSHSFGNAMLCRCNCGRHNYDLYLQETFHPVGKIHRQVKSLLQCNMVGVTEGIKIGVLWEHIGGTINPV